MSPVEKSLKLLRKQGYTVAITERWNPFAKVRQDLFGFCDLLAIAPGEILAIQTTTRTNLSARRKKIAAEERSRKWLEAGGRIQLHGWNKGQVKVESFPS